MKTFFRDTTQWAWLPDIMAGTPCFALFRRTFEASDNSELKLNISADNRYNLYIDGKRIGRGPCRSDLEHYNFESYNAPLSAGRHTVAVEVVVYNYGFRGDEGPLGEIHAGGGLAVAGGIFKDDVLDLDLGTPGEWKCVQDNSRKHRRKKDNPAITNFFAAAPTEEVAFDQSPRDWNAIEFDDSAWLKTESVGPARLRSEIIDTSTKWWLIPREIPPMEEKKEPISKVFKVEGVDAASVNIIDGELRSLSVPSGKKAKITLDMGQLATAFPRLSASGAKGASIKITYSESLFVDGKKLERDNKDGSVKGYFDLLTLDDGACVFEPFWFRTFRFVELEIDSTGSKGFVLDSLSITSFLYPFELKAEFDDGSSNTPKIWETAWRTARLCAHEHYEDCPYYEQLQYVGDTRIQALISYSATGDGRLGRQAILQYDWSRLAEGITQSRYPSSWVQIIPGFSLFWVLMVYDYYWYFGDKELVKEVLPGIKSVLDWFERRKLDNNLIGHLPYWNFTDWVGDWPGGSSSDRCTGNPQTINALLYAEACDKTAYLCEELGNSIAEEYRTRRDDGLNAVNSLCYDSELALYVDMPGTKFVSQHVNSLAIIAGAANTSRAENIGHALMNNKNLSPATLYFSFYLFRAWEKADCYGYFWDQLKKWESIFKWNFTTFPEKPDASTRSDCHAWSASPIHEYLTCVLGIKPNKPGFGSILIKPCPGALKAAKGKAPAGDQIVELSWKTKPGNEMELEVKLQTPTQIVIEWPDGQQEHPGRVLSGSFSRKILG